MPKRHVSSVDEGLGRNMVFFRKLAGLTQQQVAEQLNLNRSTYTKYETGMSEPGIEMLKNIARVLDVNVAMLLADDLSVEAMDLMEESRRQTKRKVELLQMIESLPEDEQTRLIAKLEDTAKTENN